MLRDMDASVLAALAKWPNVTDVYGWLSLTARGEWRLRGEAIGNDAIRAFIGRNYACDDAGRWFFQNGPQRVFVSLDVAPWVLRLQAGGVIAQHGERLHQCRAAALLDGSGLVLATEAGAGLIDDRDAGAVTAAMVDAHGDALDDNQLARALDGGTDAFLAAARLGLAGGVVKIEQLALSQLESRFGFVREPCPP